MTMGVEEYDNRCGWFLVLLMACICLFLFFRIHFVIPIFNYTTRLYPRACIVLQKR